MILLNWLVCLSKVIWKGKIKPERHKKYPGIGLRSYFRGLRDQQGMFTCVTWVQLPVGMFSRGSQGASRLASKMLCMGYKWCLTPGVTLSVSQLEWLQTEMWLGSLSITASRWPALHHMARYFNPDLPGCAFDPPFPQTDRPKADRQTGQQTQSQAGKQKGWIHKTEQSTSQLYCNHLTVLDRDTHIHTHTAARTCAHARTHILKSITILPLYIPWIFQKMGIQRLSILIENWTISDMIFPYGLKYIVSETHLYTCTGPTFGNTDPESLEHDDQEATVAEFGTF